MGGCGDRICVYLYVRVHSYRSNVRMCVMWLPRCFALLLILNLASVILDPLHPYSTHPSRPLSPSQGHHEAATNLGYILLRKREFAAAIEQFSAAIDHGSAAAMYHMGQVRFSLSVRVLVCVCVSVGSDASGSS